jgi:hypothetical protein
VNSHTNADNFLLLSLLCEFSNLVAYFHTLVSFIFLLFKVKATALSYSDIPNRIQNMVALNGWQKNT